MLAEIIAGLKLRRLPPRPAGGDPLADAWAAAGDPEEMVELLALGERIGLYNIGGITRTDAPDGSRRWLFRLRTPEGKYLRMDFTREGGAGLVRSLLPAIAPYEAWAAAIEDERVRIEDPIVLLLLDLRRTGAVDPRWLSRWTLPEAWRASKASIAMRALLSLLGREDLQRAAQRAIDRGTPPPMPEVNEFGPPDQLDAYFQLHEDWLVSTIRSAVPEPPPLPATALDRSMG